MHHAVVDHLVFVMWDVAAQHIGITVLAGECRRKGRVISSIGSVPLLPVMMLVFPRCFFV